MSLPVYLKCFELLLNSEQCLRVLTAAGLLVDGLCCFQLVLLFLNSLIHLSNLLHVLKLYLCASYSKCTRRTNGSGGFRLDWTCRLLWQSDHLAYKRVCFFKDACCFIFFGHFFVKKSSEPVCNSSHQFICMGAHQFAPVCCSCS